MRDVQLVDFEELGEAVERVVEEVGAGGELGAVDGGVKEGSSKGVGGYGGED